MIIGCFRHGIFRFLRSGEFKVTRNLPVGDCLRISDPYVDSVPFPNLIRLRIKVSKADPFRVLYCNHR